MKPLPMFLFLPVLVLAFRTCEPGPTVHQTVREVPVIAVTMPADPRAGEPCSIDLTCATPTPCWEFHRTDITHSDSLVILRVFARYDGRPCIQIPGTITATATVTLARAGLYQFRFTGRDSTQAVRELIVR